MFVNTMFISTKIEYTGNYLKKSGINYFRNLITKIISKIHSIKITDLV